MATKKIFLVSVLVFSSLTLSSCSSATNTEDERTVLVDLVESTQIVNALIREHKLSDILQDHDEDQLALLLNNVSPAQLAFEAEVKSSTISSVVIYYYQDSPHEQEFIIQLKELAHQYDNRVKFVIIDADKLFSLAHDAHIEKFPTAVMIRYNSIAFNLTDTITIDQLKCSIEHELAKK